LDPGHYVFRVKASNNDGIWNDQGLAFDVTITPPFWQTWWFRSFIIGLSILAIYLVYQMRIRGLIYQQWVLEQQVADRTQEVIYQKDLVELEKAEIEHQKLNVESANLRLEKALSELRETQQQLVFQAKMISMGTLTAGVAHEINNPTNFAHAGAQSLEMDLERFRGFLMDLAGDEATGEIGQTISQRVDALVAQAANITVGTSRIRDLIKDLRSFSRLGEADRKTVSIQDSLLSTINLVRTQYADLVDIQCHFSSNPLIECWPAQLNQVFMNVIVNACQAIEQKHREYAHALQGKLDIRGRQEADNFLIEFEDNGCGISVELLERIFDPFYTTRAEGEGTGLGLSISFGIIKKHQGDISVRSIDGEGCCFTVRLPLNPPADLSAESRQTT
ncbi:MAG TPA: ATP-binding protein, partial [Burkholderiaceae bacterium]|nr:ATP-binding protein [Burkholderiaceae bacterium]